LSIAVRPPASGQRPAIGFVWLCFFAASNRKYFHILFTNEHLTRFAYFKIGFVFSNRVFNPQKIWGLNKIGFVWL